MCGGRMGSDTPATYFKTVSIEATQFEPLTREGKLYISALSPPLQVSTPPIRLGTGVSATDLPFVYVNPEGAFKQFLQDVEARVLDACIENKDAWFDKGVEEDYLRQNFKSFFSDAGFKVRVTDDVAVFDPRRTLVAPEEAEAGCLVRCVLELARICFGKREFGAMWRLVQVQLLDEPRCLIEDDRSEDGGDDEETYSEDGDVVDEQEFS